MNPFRSIISSYKDDICCIKVIGYKQIFTEEVYAASGIEDYFLFLLPPKSWCYWEGKRISLSKSALILQPPHTAIRHGQEGGLIRSWIRFNGKNMESLCRLNGIDINRLYEIDNLADHEEYLIALYREVHHPKGAIPANVNNLFTNWLRSIGRDGASPSGIPDQRIILAREYMEQNFREKKEMKDICLHSGLSRNDLCRYFRDYYKTSPMQYIISLRISLARELLHNSQLPLEVIAEQSGFSDRYYFSRCFKKHTGATPGQFRKGKN